jgi:hypothetical protein
MLAERRQDIAALGTQVIVDHPSAGRDQPTNCRSIANAFVRQELWTTQRIRQNEGITQFGDQGVIEYFVKQFSSREARIIVSAEAFCYLRTRAERKHLQRILNRLNCEVIPLVYFRKEADWRASWTAQNGGPILRAFREQHPDKFTLFDDWYYDRSAIADFWTALSPLTTFFDYDQEVARRGSVIPSFLDLVGLPQSFNSRRYFLNARRASRRPARIGAVQVR